LYYKGKTVAGELGFEPRQTESESVVLPLHHSPIIAQRHQQVRRSIGQLLAIGFMESRDLAPFYSLAAALGKRAAMGLVHGGGGKSAAIGGAVGAAVRAVGA
jgi:hypothetical protein